MPGISQGIISVSGHDFVTFAPDCPSIPSDLPVSGWQSKHNGVALAHNYHFDNAGQLHMRQTGSDFDFVSANACGTFLLYRPEISGALLSERWVSFQDGRLSGISSTDKLGALPGFCFSPTWEISGARTDGVAQAYLDNNLEACVEFIRDARLDPSIKGGSRTSEFMLALALCASERLAGTRPDVAWRALTQAQRQAASSWFIGLASRKEDCTNT
jgi:hypothetical protein